MKICYGKNINFGWIIELMVSRYLESMDLNLKVGDFITFDNHWDMARLVSLLPLGLLNKTKGISIPMSNLDDQPIYTTKWTIFK